MTDAVASTFAAPRAPVWRFLSDELAVSPSRWSRMVRITVIVTLVTIVSNVLRVPHLGVSAFLIFMVSQSDVAATVRTGVGASIALILAVIVTLVLWSLTFGQPALRVPTMALVFFGGMYLTRTSPAGPLIWIVAFVVGYAQTFADLGVSAEDGPDRNTEKFHTRGSAEPRASPGAQSRSG